MKKILGLYSAPRQHWAGDGFPVRSLFSYHTHGAYLSPFCCSITPARRLQVP